MAKSKSTRARRAQPRPSTAGEPRSLFPVTAVDKVISAKSIVQAVIAAEESGSLSDQNFDASWALNVAVELLEQAGEQMDSQDARS